MVHPKAIALVAVLTLAFLPFTSDSNADAAPDTVTLPAPAPGQVWVLMRQCANEDGNPDGRPCVWVDPDTGDAYLSDSANYRTEKV